MPDAPNPSIPTRCGVLPEPSIQKGFEKLGEEVKEIARERYRKFADNPYGPGVDFHAIKGTNTKDVVAVNAGTHLKVQYRALGVFDRKAQEVDWFWIGPHEEYNNLLKRL